jgi:hypothetical protein
MSRKSGETADVVKRSRLPDFHLDRGGATIVVRHLVAGGPLPSGHEAIDERQGAAAWLATAIMPGTLVPLEAEGTSHAAVSLGANRRAGWVLTALLMLLSIAMALSKTALDAGGSSMQQLAAGAGPEVASFWPMLQIAPLEHVLENWWPTIPALGLLWRWRTWQMLGATLAYGLLCFAVSAGQDAMLNLEYLALVYGVSLLLVSLLCLAPTTRAIAPWLLPLFLVLLVGSLAGADLLAAVKREFQLTYPCPGQRPHERSVSRLRQRPRCTARVRRA